ncbi:MAG TPA: hypothetical protein DCZ10_00390 [Pelotomaculum sp.]|nr:hypothetical protein [Pelotomaculum sp.]
MLPQIGKSFININSIFAKTNNGNHGKQLQSLDVDTVFHPCQIAQSLTVLRQLKAEKVVSFRRQYSVGILWEMRTWKPPGDVINGVHKLFSREWKNPLLCWQIP